MTTRRTVLNVEQLGARVLPSATLATTPSPTTTNVASTTVHPFGQAWTGQGRFTTANAAAAGAKSYTLQGSADLGGSNFYSISGSVTAVGNKTGQASGKVVLSSPKGTLTLTLTGPTQSAKSALPSTLTYKIVSGTGAFAHYAGSGTMKMGDTLFIGYSDRGQFSFNAAAPVGATKVPTPTPKPTPTPVPGPITTGPSWTGQGRFTVANPSAVAKAYALQGSADFGSIGFFNISGTVTSVGSKSGQAIGRVTLSDGRGTLTLSLVGPTQAANSHLPASFNYKVVSGTGFFAHYVGQGNFQLAPTLFIGYDDKGHFAVAVKPTSK